MLLRVISIIETISPNVFQFLTTFAKVIFNWSKKVKQQTAVLSCGSNILSESENYFPIYFRRPREASQRGTTSDDLKSNIENPKLNN